jgi:hypothetical protein
LRIERKEYEYSDWRVFSDKWQTEAERWVTLGATHVTFYTSGQGIGAVEQQIEAMNQFYDAVR